MSIKARIKLITPEMAKKILDKAAESGCINRQINRFKVETYADAIKKGQWKDNGVAISFDENGILMDGQHRLHACILAGLPISVMVHENVSRDTFDTFDCGVPRTAGQVLSMAGISKYSHTVASIVRGVNDLRHIGHTALNMMTMTNTQVREICEQDSEMYQYAAQFASCAVVTSKCLTPKMVGTVAYYLIRDLKQDIKVVENFLTGITSIDSSENPYINKLRRWLISHRGERMSDRTKLGYIILTWNAMVTNSRMPAYTEKNVETMPTFIAK